MRELIPFSGNLPLYGAGPEHLFFKVFKSTIDGTPAQPGPDPVATDPTNPGQTNEAGGGGTGGGLAGLGVGERGDPATADLSTSETDDAGEFGMAALSATNPALATVATLANIALDKNEEPTKMGLRGFVDTALGFDGPTQAEIDNAMDSPAFGGVVGSPTDNSFAGFAETSGLYGGSDSSSGGSGVGSGGGDAAGPDGGGPGGSGTGGQKEGGLIKAKRYAGGGAISGPGGGMDDLIPATINGRDLARLSDGEFVIPADVVSALGDGSSNAGAKRLYDLIKGVRTKKFGKESQPPKLKAGLATLLGSV